MTHEQLQDAHIAALREIMELRAQRDRLKETCERVAEEVMDYLNTETGIGKPEEPELWQAVERMKQERRQQIAQLQTQLATAKNDFDLQRDYADQLKGEVDRLKAQLATANERVTRMRSLLQRAQTIITLDANLYTIWREDAGEELAKRKEGA